jgi:hypothetical protein
MSGLANFVEVQPTWDREAMFQISSMIGRSRGWRIVISPIIPYDSPSCYHSSMRHLFVLFIHLIALLTQLFQPSGVRSLVAESLLLKHQLLIVNRSRQRSPNLSSWDRILAGWMALLIRPTRLLRSAIVLKPSTLLAVISHSLAEEE